MWPNPLVTFTEEILNGKLHFLCSVLYVIHRRLQTFNFFQSNLLIYKYYLLQIRICKLKTSSSLLAEIGPELVSSSTSFSVPSVQIGIFLENLLHVSFLTNWPSLLFQTIVNQEILIEIHLTIYDNAHGEITNFDTERCIRNAKM